EKSELDFNEQYIKKRENLFFQQKVKRLKYLHKINPHGLTLAGQAELVLTYREVQLCYIDGHFLATIILSQAFVEKIIHDFYNKLGHQNIAKKGFNEILKHAGINNLINEYIIKQINLIRQIRNPITHLKTPEYEHSLDKRSFKNTRLPHLQI